MRGRRICQKIEDDRGIAVDHVREPDGLAPHERGEERRGDPERQQDQEGGPRSHAPGAPPEVEDGDRPLAAADDLEAGAEEAVEHLRPQNLRRGAGGELSSRRQGEEPVAEERGEVEVVRGEDDGVVRPLLEAEEEGGEIALMAGVEVEGGLVEHQQLRLLGQGGGDEDRLPLAAGEARRRGGRAAPRSPPPAGPLPRRRSPPAGARAAGSRGGGSARGGRSPPP